MVLCSVWRRSFSFEDLVLPLLCFVCVFDVVRLVIFEDLFSFLLCVFDHREREIEYYKSNNILCLRKGKKNHTGLTTNHHFFYFMYNI